MLNVKSKLFRIDTCLVKDTNEQGNISDDFKIAPMLKRYRFTLVLWSKFVVFKLSDVTDPLLTFHTFDS